MITHSRVLLAILAIVFVAVALHSKGVTLGVKTPPAKTTLWDFQSIDTMKFSRDPSLEKLTDPNFDVVIDTQTKNIAQTGVTHIAIATPYDEKFLPILKRWVKAARKYHLKVWFRGNFSGWEKWFGYSQIDRDDHKRLLTEFITKNPDLFEDGDVFSPCPECENGGPGDPRSTGDVQGYRDFLVSEKDLAEDVFNKLGKDIKANYASMNADVARLVMDKGTTEKMDGLVVIDHYVTSPKQVVSDAVAISENSGGKVVLGEYGAPIPDLNGKMTDSEQAAWLTELLSEVSRHPEIVGLSYWTSVGGSTELWTERGFAKPAVGVLKTYYQPKQVTLQVVDNFGTKLNDVIISTDRSFSLTNSNGEVTLPILTNTEIQAQKDGFESKNLTLDGSQKSYKLVLDSDTQLNFFEKLLAQLRLAF